MIFMLKTQLNFMKKKSEITTLLIGTHLATYQNQPAFG
jgi:hypothetical protein